MHGSIDIAWVELKQKETALCQCENIWRSFRVSLIKLSDNFFQKKKVVLIYAFENY